MDDLVAAADITVKKAENVKEEKVAEVKNAKYEIRILNNLKKIESFKNTFEAIGDCEDMSEQTISGKTCCNPKNGRGSLMVLLKPRKLLTRKLLGYHLIQI